MPTAREVLARSSEPLVVALARRGERYAFEELVRRRQSWVRNLMRRLARDTALADDLAQQVFLQMWRTLGQLQQPAAFPGWLKRTAVNIWLQHQRRNDPLDADTPPDDTVRAILSTDGVAIDVDQALALLPDRVRLCIVLSYHLQMSHAEIADATSLPLGTVKSHIRLGTERLRLLLSDYSARTAVQVTS